MEEVEMICDRVIILDRGKIMASGTTDELKDLIDIEEKISLEVFELSPDQLATIETFDHIHQVKYVDNKLELSYRQGKHNLSHLIEYFSKQGISYDKIYSERPTLNDVFLALTGKELRD